MNILLIGSEGFIGKHCVSYFLNKGYNVYGADLLDYTTQKYHYTKISRTNPNFDSLFGFTNYDFCINAAGNGSVPVSIEKPLSDFDANCYDVIRVLQLIKDKNPNCRYLHFSSAAVYGNPQSLPIKENASLHPLSPYGWHKLVSEKLCEEYSTLYNIPISVVRPFSVYGPGLRKQLIWDMGQKALNYNNTSIELWGDGKESRDFIYIDDLIAGIDIVLKSTVFGLVQYFNLGTGVETNIISIAENFYSVLNPDIKFHFNNKIRIGDPRNWQADITKLSVLGFNAKYTLKEGLKLTAEWIKESI